MTSRFPVFALFAMLLLTFAAGFAETAPAAKGSRRSSTTT